MGTDIRAGATSQNSFTNDAEFRLFGTQVHDLLALAGLVQTADSGQIAWTAPPVSFQPSGFVAPRTFTFVGASDVPWTSVLNTTSPDLSGYAYLFFDVTTAGTVTIDKTESGDSFVFIYNSAGAFWQSGQGDQNFTASVGRWYVVIRGYPSASSGTVKIVPGTAVLGSGGAVARPTVTSTYAGYEIWRFNDSLQATKPFFMKVEYGVATVLSNPSLRITPGRGSDGAGNLIDAGTQMSCDKQGSGAGSLFQHTSWSAGRLNLLLGVVDAVTSNVMLLFVERTKDAAGNPTDDGVVIMSASGGSVAAFRWQFFPMVGAAQALRTIGASLDPASGGLWSYGGDVILMPSMCFNGKPLYTSWLVYRVADITKMVSFVLNYLGSHTFMPYGNNLNATAWTTSGTGFAYSLAIPWE